MLIVSALALTLVARGALPLPIQPDCGEPERTDLCPDDLGEDWALQSWIPRVSRETIRPAESELGSGISADRAWRTSTGRFDVLLAVGDTGVNWDRGDLVRKYFLNAGELPLPQSGDGVAAASHDANGDGLFNIDDYADDPRVSREAGHPEASDRLDPSDLIAIFSDGVDDDLNGYADDISGWDFFGRDNDAYHQLETNYGEHGDGVAREMAAEGGNGGSIGVCPNCAVLPMRTGDAFIIDGTRIAEAIAYATEMNAVAVSLALGGMTAPSMAAAAIEDAWEQGTSVVSVGGDENSYHHNQPAVLPHVVYTKSIRHASIDSDEPVSTYMGQQNCNNFGARMVLAASSSACATGSTAVITGVIGLLHSAARDVGVELTAAEVVQLLTTTVDDVWLSDEEQREAKTYPSGQGWDPYTGYGRVNAARAVEAVVSGQIPPTVTLNSPRWFQPVGRSSGDVLSVSGQVSAPRSSRFEWSAELGRGEDPRDWTALGAGDGQGTETVEFARIELDALPWAPIPGAAKLETVLERYGRVSGNAWTVRVVVTDAEGREAQLRRTFFVDDDPDTLSGFPLHVGPSVESSPQLSDLDGDGVFEIVVGTSDGTVLAIRGDGTALEGWPVAVEPHASTPWDLPAVADGRVPPSPDPVMSTPAIGDIDGDGGVDVVVTTYDGGIYAWNARGELLAGFPHWTLGREPDDWTGSLYNFDQGYMGSPVLEDLDGDGQLEIIAASLDGRLYVVDAAGADWGPYPIDLCHPALCGDKGFRSIASPAVGDVDGDGDPDIGVGTNESVDDRYSVTHLIDAQTGVPLEGWPRLDSGLIGQAVLLPLVGEGHPSSLAFADLDGDGDLEISNPVMLGTSDVLHHDGSVALELPYYADDFGAGHNVDEEDLAAFVQMVTNPAWGDVNDDGTPDLVLGGAGTKYLVGLFLSEYVDYQHPLAIWSGRGTQDGRAELLPGFPQQVEDMQILAGPAVADISGDGSHEAIYGSGGWLLHAWSGDGQEVDGWPKFTGGWMLGSPAVGDITGDGLLDVVVTTREGYVFAWGTRGPADRAPEWASFRHDPRNTGNHSVRLLAQEGPREEAAQTDSGQGCCRSNDDTAAAILALPFMGLLGWSRRRSSRTTAVRRESEPD